MSDQMTLIERLRNPAYGNENRMAADMEQSATALDELRASLEEMVGVYWGSGDGQEPPLACIQRATAAIEAAKT